VVAPLELYLIRHGIAADARAGEPDETRALTEEGITQLRREAEGLDALEVVWDVILSSGLVRAWQTAEVLARTMEAEAPVVRMPALEPSGSTEEVLRELAKYQRTNPGATRLALVGHEPGMGELAARLLRAQNPLPFKKGAICCIDLAERPPRGVGVLRWFAPPRILRRVGR
jgi:phosphohistidine phosphatase